MMKLKPDNEERSMIDVEMMKLIYEEGSGVMQKDHEEETGNEDDE